jgi:glycosyltransferase involved in cell wall biosynthesis
MAAGNAIVSFKQSATILQHGETAFLVDPATDSNFAQGILTVLDDSRLAQKLRTNVKRFVLGRFDWPSIAAKLEAIYSGLVTKSPASTGRIDAKGPIISRQAPSLSKEQELTVR